MQSITVKLIKYIIGRYKGLVLVSTVIGILGAIMAFLSIGMFLPIIESFGEKNFAGFPFDLVTQYFQGMSKLSKLKIATLGLAIVTVVKSLMEYLNNLLSYKLQVVLEQGFYHDVFDELIQAELSYFTHEKSANLVSVFGNFVRHSSTVAQRLLAQVIQLFSALMYFILLLFLSWELTLLALVFVLSSTFIIKRFSVQAQNIGDRLKTTVIDLNGIFLDLIAGIKVIRIFSQEERIAQNFTSQVTTVQDIRYRLGRILSSIGPLFTSMNILILCALLMIAIYTMADQIDAWLEMTILFMIILHRLSSPVSSINKTRTSIAGFLPAVEALFEFMEDKQRKRLPSGNIQFEKFHHSVVFENVNFLYEQEEKGVLHNISFEISKGKTVALVGTSGAGKTTIANLLARLYDPSSGRIFCDGTDIREFETKSWRQAIALVSQDVFLFNNTVRYNILFGNPEASEEEVIQAAKLANAHDFIIEMKDGYDTFLGERGARLSGGQQQRIAIARALLANPQILILDEATSALDTESEKVVQDAMDRLCHDKTVLSIAHRLATIKDADTVLVLEEGMIEEMGSHEELIHKEGKYWELVNMQALGKLR